MKFKKVSNKVWEWVVRYGPTEAVATLSGYGVALAGSYAKYDSLAVSYAASWTDGLMFYVANFIREFVQCRRKKPEYSIAKVFYKSVRNCVVEFGPAHALNAFFLQPWGIYLIAKLTHNISIAFFAGTVLAEGGFYLLVISAYELRKRYLAE